MSLDLKRSTVESPASADDLNTDEGFTGEAEDLTGDGSDATPAAPARRRFTWRLLSLRRPPFFWTRALAYGLLPILALGLAGGAGYLKWQESSAQLSLDAAVQPIQAATEGTVAMLAYQPDIAEKDLTAAATRLTGSFRDEYTKLVNDLVIPGAKQRKISAVATVPAAALVSATDEHTVVLVFVNQATTISNDPPTNSASSALVTLDKVDGRWLISKFDPV